MSHAITILKTENQLLGVNRARKVEVKSKETVTIKAAMPKGMSLGEDYPWMSEPDLEKRNAIHKKWLEEKRNGGALPPPQENNILEAEFEDVTPSNDQDTETSENNGESP